MTMNEIRESFDNIKEKVCDFAPNSKMLLAATMLVATLAVPQKASAFDLGSFVGGAVTSLGVEHISDIASGIKNLTNSNKIDATTKNNKIDPLAIDLIRHHPDLMLDFDMNKFNQKTLNEFAEKFPKQLTDSNLDSENPANKIAEFYVKKNKIKEYDKSFDNLEDISLSDVSTNHDKIVLLTMKTAPETAEKLNLKNFDENILIDIASNDKDNLYSQYLAKNNTVSEPIRNIAKTNVKSVREDEKTEKVASVFKTNSSELPQHL